MLAGVADYQLKLGRLSKKRKPVDPNHSRRQGAKAGVNRIEPPPPPADPKAVFLAKHPRPEVLAHLVLGINEIGKELSIKPLSLQPPPLAASVSAGASETSATALRQPRPPPLSPLRYVFVSLSDINPPSLVGHLPAAVAGWNGRNKAAGEADATGIRLVTLAKGAEALLAQALGVRRAAVLGVRVRNCCLEPRPVTSRFIDDAFTYPTQASCPPRLLSQLEAVLPLGVLSPLLVEHLIPTSVKVRSSKAPTSEAAPAFLPTQPGAPVVSNSSQQQSAKTRPKATKTLLEARRSLAPMRVKMVKTSAPKDMKASKVERTLAVAQKRKAHKAVKKAQARRQAEGWAAGAVGEARGKSKGRRMKKAIGAGTGSAAGAPAA